MMGRLTKKKKKKKKRQRKVHFTVGPVKSLSSKDFISEVPNNFFFTKTETKNNTNITKLLLQLHNLNLLTFFLILFSVDEQILKLKDFTNSLKLVPGR